MNVEKRGVINKDCNVGEWIQRSVMLIFTIPEGFVPLNNGSDEKESRIITIVKDSGLFCCKKYCTLTSKDFMPKKWYNNLERRRGNNHSFFIVLLCYSPIFLCVFLDPVLASAGGFNRCLYSMFGLCFNYSI